jgi:drug/metabolite transporter (DMT)-like permease
VTLRNRGRLAILLAAVLWSTSGVFVRFLSAPDIVLTVYRALFAGLTMMVALAALRIRPTWDWRMTGMILSFALMNYWYMTAINRTTAANAVFLQYSAPLFVFLAGVLLLGEPFRMREFLAVTLGAAGVVVLIIGEVSRGDGIEKALAYGLLSGAGFAAVVVFLRLLRGHPPLWLTGLNQLSAAGAAALVAWLAWRLQGDSSFTQLWPPPEGRQMGLLALFGAFQFALPYVLFGWGLQHVRAEEAGVLALVEPMLNPVWTYLSHGEKPSGWTLLGGAILLAALLWQTLGGEKETPETTPAS